MPSPTQLALIVLGCVLVLATFSRRRLASAYRATAVILVNFVVMVAVLEVVASRFVHDDAPSVPAGPRELFGRGRDSLSLDSVARDTSPPESELPYYRDQTWAAQHWRELRASRADYHPYVLWRRAPFRGRTIHVDSAGYRVTPGSSCANGNYTVYVLGGSTVWGYGVPDWGTLPAYLAAELSARRHAPVCVVNLGELGFNSTQDLIELERQLQAGRVPDLVIAYQGINDVWTAAQNGKPGLHFYLEEIAGRLEGGKGQPTTTSWLAKSNLFRFAAQHALRRAAPAAERLPGYMQKRWIAPDSLGAEVVRLYLQNYTMLDALSHEYGFALGVFWQPNLLADGKPLGTEEREFRQREADEGDDWVALMQRSYARIAAEAPHYPHLHVVANVFARDTTVLYSDWAHLNPEGNRRIARVIAAALGDSLTARPLAASRVRRAGAAARSADQ